MALPLPLRVPPLLVHRPLQPSRRPQLPRLQAAVIRRWILGMLSLFTRLVSAASMCNIPFLGDLFLQFMFDTFGYVLKHFAHIDFFKHFQIRITFAVIARHTSNVLQTIKIRNTCIIYEHPSVLCIILGYALRHAMINFRARWQKQGAADYASYNIISTYIATVDAYCIFSEMRWNSTEIQRIFQTYVVVS